LWSGIRPGPAGSPRWARRAPYVDAALRLGRPAPWREVYDRLRAVTAEDEAIEAIGDLRELLEVEDLLLSAVPPPERGDHS
jgi:hypothetical protein